MLADAAQPDLPASGRLSTRRADPHAEAVALAGRDDPGDFLCDRGFALAGGHVQISLTPAEADPRPRPDRLPGASGPFESGVAQEVGGLNRAPRSRRLAHVSLRRLPL